MFAKFVQMQYDHTKSLENIKYYNFWMEDIFASNFHELFKFVILFLGPLLNLGLCHLNYFYHTQTDSISTGNYLRNQKHNYLNAIKGVHLMVGKQLLISTSLINPFGTSVINQHVRESIKLISFYQFFPQAE